MKITVSNSRQTYPEFWGTSFATSRCQWTILPDGSILLYGGTGLTLCPKKIATRGTVFRHTALRWLATSSWDENSCDSNAAAFSRSLASGESRPWRLPRPTTVCNDVFTDVKWESTNNGRCELVRTCRHSSFGTRHRVVPLAAAPTCQCTRQTA